MLTMVIPDMEISMAYARSPNGATSKVKEWGV